jgi:hypothetical protein
MMRRAVFLGLGVVVLAGCGDARLTGRGHVRIETSDDVRAAIELPTDIRLDGEVQPGRITGSCRIARSRVGGVIVTVELYTHSDVGLRSVTLMQGSDPGAQGLLEARLTGGTFRATNPCDLALSYVDDQGSVVLDARVCALDGGDGRTGTSDVHLELHGCALTED